VENKTNFGENFHILYNRFDEAFRNSLRGLAAEWLLTQYRNDTENSFGMKVPDVISLIDNFHYDPGKFSCHSETTTSSDKLISVYLREKILKDTEESEGYLV